jgi:ribosomal protein S7
MHLKLKYWSIARKNHFYSILKNYDIINNINSYFYFLYDPIISKFINRLMVSGNKNKSFLLIKNILFKLKKITYGTPFFFIRGAILNSRLLLEMKFVHKRSRSTYYPIFYNRQTQIHKAIRLLIDFCNNFNAHNLSKEDKFILCILLCYFKKGIIIKRLKKLNYWLKNRRIRNHFYRQFRLNTKLRLQVKIKSGKKRKSTDKFHLRKRKSISYWIKKVK